MHILADREEKGWFMLSVRLYLCKLIEDESTLRQMEVETAFWKVSSSTALQGHTPVWCFPNPLLLPSFSSCLYFEIQDFSTLLNLTISWGVFRDHLVTFYYFASVELWCYCSKWRVEVLLPPLPQVDMEAFGAERTEVSQHACSLTGEKTA